jgi:hypothetical protein
MPPSRARVSAPALGVRGADHVVSRGHMESGKETNLPRGEKSRSCKLAFSPVVFSCRNSEFVESAPEGLPGNLKSAEDAIDRFKRRIPFAAFYRPYIRSVKLGCITELLLGHP